MSENGIREAPIQPLAFGRPTEGARKEWRAMVLDALVIEQMC